MTATIIPFPAKPSPAVSKIEESRSADGSQSHWTGWDQYLFEHLLDHGHTSDHATLFVEREIHSRCVPDTGPDRLLRQAREALGFMEPPRS